MITPAPDSRVERSAQQAHIDDETAPTKAAGLAEVLMRPEVAALGVEYKLFTWLLVVNEGEARSSYQRIGEWLGTDGRNVRNWALKLKGLGLVAIADRGRDVEITLATPYWEVASMDERPTPADSEPKEEDPALDRLIAMYRAAKATGSKLKLLTESEFTGGISS